MILINRFLYTMMLYLVLVSCLKDDVNDFITYPPFVRFHFLVDANNQPLESPRISSRLVPKNTHKITGVKTLKIPIALSATHLNNKVTVNYSIKTKDSQLIDTKPQYQLLFDHNKRIDTLYVSFNKRWKKNREIILKLESVSDNSIHIGNLNEEYKNDIFKIQLNSLSTTYTLPSKRLELKGKKGEQVTFKVLFPNGFILSEIKRATIFKFENGFDYTIKVKEYDTSKRFITYSLTLNEDINKDEVYYETTIVLQDIKNYTPIKNKIIKVIKPVVVPRDKSVNTAANFYNLSNPFYRTYGENWADHNKKGTCSWQSFFAFTYPVVVSSDHVNAVLYDNRGTLDVTDDVYHHAFKISFDARASATATTNSFNLKRWFTSESFSSTNSPGFNIKEAIEFFPENGNSTTGGTVLINSENITISNNSKPSKSYSIAMSGKGTYKKVKEGLFEISFEIKLTNEDLFGGSVISYYKLYNNALYTKPTPLLTTTCITSYDL